MRLENTHTTPPPTRTRPKVQRDCSTNSRDGDAQRGGSSNSRESWRDLAKNGGSAGGMASLPQSWSRMDRRQERDVRELVRLVAGVQDEADPNFQLALQFAWSNFRCGSGIAAGEGKGLASCVPRPAESPRSLPLQQLMPSCLLGARGGDQFSSVAQSSSTLCYSVDCGTPGLAQTMGCGLLRVVLRSFS